MNQRLPPGVTQAQLNTACKCPMNCQPDPTFQWVQTLGHRERGGVVQTIYSRCLSCLAYWETDTSGKIVKLSRPVSIEICPDCRQPMDENLRKIAGLEKNLCKNPGHVASSLLRL